MSTDAVTFADQYHIAGYLVACADLDIASLSIWPTDMQAMVKDARSLHAGCNLLEGPSVSIMDTQNEAGILVTVTGTFRGVSTAFFASFCAGADLDLIRSFPDPSPAMVAALAGDVRDVSSVLAGGVS